MRIGKINNETNFGSKVLLTDAPRISLSFDNILSAAEKTNFLKAIKKLERNGERDTVKFFIADGADDYNIGAEVINGRLRGQALESKAFVDLSVDFFMKLYNKATQKLTAEVSRQSVFDKYRPV